ncbi:MAG: hypothetical protein ABSD44_02545 [Terracidiphilus sp.]
MELSKILSGARAIASVSLIFIPIAAPVAALAQAAASVEFRSYEKMTQRDRDLAANAESTIGERAGADGIEFGQVSERGQWTSEQIVCPALPNHLLLQFTRNNGKGDMSAFSASIPRGGEGRVRIIPILRRGYSLFSPVPINELTISAFNHILAEEASGAAPDWLGTGLCYAALAGAHPRAATAEAQDLTMLADVAPGTRAARLQGGAVISFTDLSAAPAPMEWTLTFDGKGRLVQASHSKAEIAREKTKAGTQVEATATAAGKPVEAIRGTAQPDAKAANSVAQQSEVKPIQRTAVEVQGKPVAQTEDVQGKPVPQ